MDYPPHASVLWIKKNDHPRISSIEQKIYRSLRETFDPKGMLIPNVINLMEDEGILLVEDCGKTLADHLHSGDYSSTGEMRDAFEGYLENSSRTRTIVNELIDVSLSPEEKAFLQEYHYHKLRKSFAETMGREIDREELKTHYWAYRAMNALGIDDSGFRDSYTKLIGSQLDKYTEKFGSWLSDNTLRNNASPDGKIVVPFDFNSLKYGPRQIDEATIAGLFLLGGPLGVYQTLPEITNLAAKLQRWAGREEDPEYLRAFLLCSFHENAVLAGYRAKESEKRFERILKSEECTRKEALAFRKAYDEVEYHHDVAALLTDLVPEQLVAASNLAELRGLCQTVTQHSFLRRSPLLLRPEFRVLDAMAREEQERERDSLTAVTSDSPAPAYCSPELSG